MRLLASLVLGCLATTSALADVTPANVATLVQRWNVPGGGVTGGPILRDGRLYVGSWDATVKALDPETGAAIWSTPVGGFIPGRVLVTDDGAVCYGTFTAEVGCLNASDGSVRWQTSLFEPGPGTVWSAPVAANGRLFVGVASQSDQPCVRGRLVALDMDDGHELWRFNTVPEKVCTTDTATTCTENGDCPSGGMCVIGRGGGVTASPIVDDTGEWVYMNTVGCYTFPSIGESDSMFKIRASDGDVAWRHRVNLPEQFGRCEADTSIECGTNGDCPAGACQTKAFYHDFGFLNGPLRAVVPDGLGGTKTIIISGSKNGTLYAFEEATGEYAWTNVLRATPITPGFAGFGLFNGALEIQNNVIYAALNVLIPERVCSNDAKRGCRMDGDCLSGGTCPPANKHLKAFDAATGNELWGSEIGESWSHVGVGNGIVFSGTNTTVGDAETSYLYAHLAATGQELARFDIPASSIGRPVVAGDTVYVPYGVGVGGVLALSFCGNGNLDDGEECDGGSDAADCCTSDCTLEPAGTTCGEDDQNVCTSAACDASGMCIVSLPDAPCDDGDACTGGDQCSEGSCEGGYTTIAELDCALARLSSAPCGDEVLPVSLSRAVDKGLRGIQRMLEKAASFAAKGKSAKVEKLRRTALSRLDGLGARARKASESKKASRRISVECRATVEALVAQQRTVVGGFVF